MTQKIGTNMNEWPNVGTASAQLHMMHQLGQKYAGLGKASAMFNR